MTYRLIVKRKGYKDIVRTGLDKLNATVIPAELKMAYPELIGSGQMKIIITKEN